MKQKNKWRRYWNAMIINSQTQGLIGNFTRSSASFNFFRIWQIDNKRDNFKTFYVSFSSFVDTRRKKQIICTIALSVMQVKLFGIIHNWKKFEEQNIIITIALFEFQFGIKWYRWKGLFSCFIDNTNITECIFR